MHIQIANHVFLLLRIFAVICNIANSIWLINEYLPWNKAQRRQTRMINPWSSKKNSGSSPSYHIRIYLNTKGTSGWPLLQISGCVSWGSICCVHGLPYFPKITEWLLFLSQTDQHGGAVYMAQPNNYKYWANSKSGFEGRNRFKLTSSYAFTLNNQKCPV